MGKRKSDGGKSENYAVGYRKPPLQSRWKPGESPNPKGRKKGVQNLKTALKATLKIPVKITQRGKQRTVSTQEAILLRIRDKALLGDHRSVVLLLSLAQAHGDEGVSAIASVLVNDAKVLETFKSRLRSGAIKDANRMDEASASAAPSSFADKGAEAPESKRIQVPRRRLTKPREPDKGF